MESQAENSQMECILANPGLRLIADKVISHLSIPDLQRCQQVSKDFQYIITERFVKKIKIIRMFRMNLSSILSNNKRNNVSAWDKFLQTFDEYTRVDKLEVVTDFLEFYSKKTNHEKSPFLVAIWEENTDFIKLILECPIDTSHIVREVPKGVKYGRPTFCFNITDTSKPIALPEWLLVTLGGPECPVSIKFKEDEVKEVDEVDEVDEDNGIYDETNLIELTFAHLEDLPWRANLENRTYCMSGIDGIDIYAIPGFGNRVLIGPFNKPYEMVGSRSKMV